MWDGNRAMTDGENFSLIGILKTLSALSFTNYFPQDTVTARGWRDVEMQVGVGTVNVGWLQDPTHPSVVARSTNRFGGVRSRPRAQNRQPSCPRLFSGLC